MRGAEAAWRPRVVFIDHVARVSGGEIALLRLVPALLEHVDVHVILGEDGPLVGRLLDAGAGVEVLHLDPRLRDLRRATVRPTQLDPRTMMLVAPYAWRLSRRLRAVDADIVHTNSLKAAIYGGIAARLVRLPVVWHLRDRIAYDYLPRPGVALVRGASHVIPSVVVANSRATLETLPGLRRGCAVLGHVVLDGVQPEVRAPRVHSTFTVGLVGRLAPWKGQHVFLEAFAMAFRDSAVQGRIVGAAIFGETQYEESLRRRAAALGIAEQIQFRGFCDDIVAELNELDALVHCSITPEPFGQVVLEGMAAGLPVIAADAGGPAELIEAGVTGLLTPPGDVNALAAAMRALAEEPMLRERIAAAGRQRSSEFTPQRTANQLVAIYRTLV